MASQAAQIRRMREDDSEDIRIGAYPSQDITVEVLGYCHAQVAEIKKLIASKRVRDIVHLSGNFVVVATRDPEVWIITSPYGAVAFFYSVGPSGFRYGRTVDDAVQHGTERQWNLEGLADLLALEHLTGDNTLEVEVQQTPAASILYWNGSRLQEWTATWSEIHDRHYPEGRPERAIELLCEEVARCSGLSPVISLSGGFDSRVLLASILASGGTKPELLVLGPSTSTDRMVVEAIGREFALKVHPIELTIDDYIASAETICRATSGTKPAAHWHTYIYAAKAKLTNENRLLVGTNGEFARTYYFDKGMLAVAADYLPCRLTLHKFWKQKVRRGLAQCDASEFRSETATYLQDGDEQLRRLARTRSGGTTLHELARFYIDERVRHFYANGLALYGQSASWRTPFLSVPWVAEVEKLARHWKLGSNWHRFALAHLCPKLLEFPEEMVAPTMAKQHQKFYWLPFRRAQHFVPYFDYTAFFAEERVLSHLLACAPHICDIIDEKKVKRIVEEHRASQQRGRLISILLGLAVWRATAASS